MKEKEKVWEKSKEAEKWKINLWMLCKNLKWFEWEIKSWMRGQDCKI